MLDNFHQTCSAFPKWESLLQRTSIKWRSFDSDVIPMTIAEMDLALPDPIVDALQEAITYSNTGYVSDWNLARKSIALAAFAQRRWHWEIDPQLTLHFCSIYDAIVESARALLTPRETIAISPPVYPPFFEYIGDPGFSLMEAPLSRTKQNEFRLDFASIRVAFTRGARAYILCNPHNPTGTVHTFAELQTLADLAAEFQVWIFSDEIHSPLTYPDQTFTPFLQVNENARKYGIAFHSATKGWNIPGLPAATAVFADESLLAKVAENSPPDASAKTSLFGCIASEVAYNECEDWLDSCIATHDFNRHYLTQKLHTTFPEINYRQPDASYLAWLDLARLTSANNPAERILQLAKVGLTEGTAFGNAGKHFARMNFSCSPNIIDQAIDRIAAVKTLIK